MRLRTVTVVVMSCAVCWSGMAAAQEPPVGATRSIRLVDDFEDQNLDGWTVPTGPCIVNIASIGAAGTSYSLVINGACGHDGGTSYDLGDQQTTGVSLYVQSTTVFNNHLFVVLDDDNQASNGYIVTFLGTSAAWFTVIAGPGTQYDLMPIPDHDWHLLHFDIDWVGKNVDVSIDGVPRQYNLPFRTNSISTLRRIHLYNLDDALAWYDQIVLSTPAESIAIMSDDFESADASGWTVASPALPQRLVIFSAGGVSGAIGGRIGADLLCGQAAQGMSGVPLHATTRAFLSVDVMDSIANMPIRYGVPTDREVTGPSTIVIADQWDDLMDGTIDTSLGDAGVLGPYAWYSGSAADGSADNDTCSGWTASIGSAGRSGSFASTDSSWISAGDSICGASVIRILCLAWR